MKQKLKIISSGAPFDVKVLDQNGQPLGFIQKITWTVDVKDQTPRAIIEVACVGIEAEVEADVVEVGPIQKEVTTTTVVIKKNNTNFKE